MKMSYFEVHNERFEKPLLVRCWDSRQAEEIAMRVMDEDNANDAVKRNPPVYCEVFNEDEWLGFYAAEI